jgi:monofunctional glycosyltransferase
VTLPYALPRGSTAAETWPWLGAMADAVSQRHRLKQSMDRPDETSGLSAAPSSTLRGESPHDENGAGRAHVSAPPRPLPANAFFRAPAGSADPAADVDVTSVEHAVREPLSADAAFSTINAEASARSLSAVEMTIAGALRAIEPLQPSQNREIVLPEPTTAPSDDLGQAIPQRMFEPRLELFPTAPAFDRLHVDPTTRPGALPRVDAVPRSPRNYWSIVRRGAKLVAWIVIAWLALVVTLIVAYRFVNPPASALMLQYWLTGQSAAQTWVPFDDISPNVVRAVLLSEDGRFCQHSGIDLEAIEAAVENSDGRSRGGSTISMQVVKNLFLWPSKSYLRKAIELPLTFLMEFVWSKRRIMEVYLNIAEWGPGIFGIGAAAGYHFDKPARNLSVRDAARLAASLPNPLVRNAGRPGPGLQRLANAIQVRMRLAPSGQLSCVLSRRPF